MNKKLLTRNETSPPRADTPRGDARTRARSDVSSTRRKLGESSLHAFVKIYLGAHCTDPPSPMHLELFELLEGATSKRARRIAIAAPRGHAKTTLVNTAYVLWSICYKKEPYIMMVSATSDQANDHLSHVKKELQENQRLIQDFPEACEVPGNPPKSQRWRKNEIITRNNVKITACGEGTGIRGRKFRQHRPTLILIDDLEMRERVFSEEQRAKTRDWFLTSLCKMGCAATNIIVVGTILHYDSLLCNLTNQDKSPAWDGRIYRAIVEWPERTDLWCEWENIFRRRTEFEGSTGKDAAHAFYQANSTAMDQGAKVLWPERESLYQLMEMRESEERGTFDSEKQNEPVHPGHCYFPENEMHFWDDVYPTEDHLFTALGKNAVVVGACDPSMGRAGSASRGAFGRGDYSALIMLLWHLDGGVVYVLDADIRHRSPDQIIEDSLGLYQHRRCLALGIEVNGFQRLLGDQLTERAKSRRMQFQTYQIQNTSEKKGRIQRLQPMITRGEIRFSRRHRFLLDQLRQFPLGAHDDGPDALEMAVQTACAYGVHLENLQVDEQIRQFNIALRMAGSDHPYPYGYGQYPW